MDLTVNLLKIIGSPFCDDNEHLLPENKEEALELYDYAKKNKIGLLYLNSIKNRELLSEFGLDIVYNDELNKNNRQKVTTQRISKILNSANVHYAIFKSIMPFNATPNDVDIIHFGSYETYENVTKLICNSNFVEVKGEVDAEQRMFHDTIHGGYLIPHPLKKDEFDVDLYQKISASQIIYLEKSKLEGYVTFTKLETNEAKILMPEADLLAIIIHSIIPEMIFTLFVYYATLHYLAMMDEDDIDRFIDLAKNNHVTFSVKSHLSLVAETHRIVHGFVPNAIKRLLREFGSVTEEQVNLVKYGFKMPHKYMITTILKIIYEKSEEKEFKQSIVKQIIYMMNIKHARWVFSELILRWRRDTY